MKYVSELRMIDKIEKNPHFSPILKWKHPFIWQLFWCDGKLPFDDYELYYVFKTLMQYLLDRLGRYLLTKGGNCATNSAYTHIVVVSPLQPPSHTT